MSDISDKHSELDEYGVWVKKPSSANTEKESPAPAVEEPTVDASFITQAAATDLEIEQDLAEFDIDSLDVPVIEEPVIEETSIEESTIEEPAISENTIEEDTLVEDFNPESVVDEPTLDEPVTTEENQVAEDELSLDDFSLDSINDDNGPMTFEQEPEPVAEEAAPVTTEEAPATEASSEDFTFEDGEIDLDAFMSDDTPAPSSDSTPDGDVDLSAFMSDDSAPGQDGEVDLSAFMGDGGDAPDFGNGDIDLEAFMGSEGFAADKQEQEEIEDADPLDIDLDFEENDNIELQDAEANGDITGIEQSTSSFTGMSDTTEVEDFDALFDDIVDETPQEQKKEAISAPKAEIPGGTEEIDLSDFGFDDDSADQNPILGDNKEEPKKQGPVDYEMNVDDDDESSSTPTVAEDIKEEDKEEDESDFDIDITQDDATSIQKEQETDLSSPDDSFDIDSILNSVEDENGGTVSFNEEKTPIVEEESIPAESEEVTDSEPMFQEPQESDFGEIAEESEIVSDFEEPTVIEDSTVMEEPDVIEEPVIEDSESSINLEDFMGEEGFTDGGPGVQGYDTVSQSETSESEDNIEESAIEEPTIEEPVIDDFSIQEPVIDEAEIEETVIEEPVIDEAEIEEPAIDEPKIEEAVIEEPVIDEAEIEEPIIENPEEMDYNDNAISDEDISLDDFMGEEGFTDGGPGVQGYDTVASPEESQETTEETEPSEENGISDFEESENSDIMEDTTETSENMGEPILVEEPVISETEKESEPMSDVTEDISTNEEEPDYSNISAFADKKPEYDMTGVTLTLDDFANIKEYPEEPSTGNTANESSAIEEPEMEETSVSDSEVIQDEPETYSVFIKTESSSGQAEYAGAVSEENDISTSTDETVADKAAVSTEETMDAFDSSSVLSQISEELASLRSEIKGLKSEFEEIKKNGIQSDSAIDSPLYDEEPAAEDTEESVELPAPSEDTGFFNDTDEDDTIALSGDELSNILSTAEFTSQAGESLDDGLKMDFSNDEALEEPVFDDSDNVMAEEESEEDEISVPTVDDVLVESSSTDLMDNTITTAEEDNDELSEITEDDIPSPTLESLDLPPYEQEEELTDDNIEFLKEGSDSVEEEELETGISEQPVEGVFNNWDAASEPELEEPVIEETVIEEPVIEETAVSESEVESSSLASNDIPASMKEEIKSVLSYMDQLLENLPEDKIAEFAQSEQFETYKKLFSELGLS